MRRILVILICLVLSGCAAPQAEKGDKPVVYAGFYAMYDFAKLIAGDTAEIICLVPPGAEPHHWEPSPQDMVKLGNADLFIYSGHGMEPFMESLKPFFAENKIKIVETAAGISPRQNDPHVWLNPAYAKIQMEAIKDALTEINPSGADTYAANYEAAASKLDALDAEYKSAVGEFTKKDVVVSHMAYGYLCDAYGLNQIAITGLSADAEPTPAKMAEIIDFVVENNVTYIFFEELVSPKLAEAIANETGAKTAVLSPFEGFPEGGVPEGGEQTYFDVMRKNLGALAEALQ